MNIQPNKNRLRMLFKPQMARLFSSTLLIAGLSVTAIGAVGCGSDQGDNAARDSEAKTNAPKIPEGPAGERKRYGTLKTQGLQTESFDLNDDGKPDQITYANVQGIVRVERDMNFNGKTDIWQYFDDSGALLEEEMDLDYDQNVDLIAFYKDGVVIRKAMSVGFDGAFTIEKFYDGEANLLRIERDQDNDGVADLWEYYDKNGDRERVGWDNDGDGTPDEFDQLP